MPAYRVLKKSFINNSLVEEGTVVEYDGEPSDNLEPLEAPAETKGKKAAKAADSALA